MNIFEGTDLNSESYGKAQDTVRKYAAERTGSKGRAPPKGGVKYSKEASGSIKQQLRKAENELNKMEPVAVVNTPDLSKMNIKQQRQWAESFLKNTGYAISRKGFGKIEFSPKHINEGLNYLNSPAEVAAFAALPRVIKRGVEIDSHKQHKGRPRSSITIAAPVHINGVRGNMAVVVTITTKNHYHAHRILLPDGSEFTFNTKKVDSTPAEAAPNAESSPIKSTYENSIRNTEKNVNEKFSREVKSAEEYFGTTYKVKEAGYICTDGKMLDFSGRHEGASGGYRTVDHRDITDALGEDYGGEDYSGGMIKFMSEGNIRVSPESGGINLSVAPNKAQRSTLDRYISSFRGGVILDIDRTNGDTIASVEYPKYTNSSVVFKDIDDYFDKGKIPEKFSREPERPIQPKNGGWERGSSYRRGRDSMGRFTSRDAGYSRRGYSRADGTDRAIEQLEDMLKDAGGESEHMAIKKAISVLKNA